MISIALRKPKEFVTHHPCFDHNQFSVRQCLGSSGNCLGELFRRGVMCIGIPLNLGTYLHTRLK